MAAIPGHHPAAARFTPARTGLLVVCAPAGLARHRFALDWSDGAAPVETGGAGLEAFVAAAAAGAAAGNPVAAVTASRAQAAAILHRVPGAVPAGPRDLLLTRDEVAALSPEAGPAAQRLWRQTGGWLGSVRRLVVDRMDPSSVADELGRALVPWLVGSEAEEAAGWIGRLPEFSPALLQRLREESSLHVPSVDVLASLGIIACAEGDRWFVPELIRRALARHGWAFKGDRSADEAIVAALAQTGRLDTAVHVAVEHRAWGRLLDLTSGSWADRFMADPAALARFAGRLPRAVKRGIDGYAVGLRVLTAVGRDRMNLPLPMVEPDYLHDRTAQHLHARMAVLARKPGNHAVTVGLLEQAHLRLAGHYPQAARAAARLRRVVAAAADSASVRPSLAGMAEVQAGISLQLGGDGAEAAHAYEAALYHARVAGSDFLAANASANLALLAAMDGDPVTLHRRLADHEAVVDRLRWGRHMVARPADLARGIEAFWALDEAGLQYVLDLLPAEIDTDEFWPAHLWLRLQAEIFAGRPDEARRRLERALHDRPYGARSAFARRFLDHGRTFLDLLDGSAVLEPGSRGGPELQILAATRALCLGRPDAALALLDAVLERTAWPRSRRQAAYLRAYARSGAAFGAPLREALHRVPVPASATADLLPLHLLGLTQRLLEESLISPEQARRLRRVPVAPHDTRARARLTAREREVLTLLRQGLARRAIAERLSVTENTVKGHLRHLYRKLGAGTAPEALEAARRAGY